MNVGHWCFLLRHDQACIARNNDSDSVIDAELFPMKTVDVKM